MKRVLGWRRVPVWLSCVWLMIGCAQRSALHRIVLDYDETVLRAQTEMLLVNIARSRLGRPLHFTTVAGVAATYELQTQAALLAELPETPGVSILSPSLGVSFTENPTITIVPVQGEEFTRRLLTPLDETTLGFFYHQGVDVALLLRLLGHGFVMESERGRDLSSNEPAGGTDDHFDRVVARLARLDSRREIDIGPLVFEQSWTWPGSGPPSLKELADLVERGYSALSETEPALSRRVIGRQVLTNYDPARLSDAERAELQARAQEYPSYFVYVDVRGEEPVRGWLKLRSLAGIFDAIGSQIGGTDDPVLEVVVSDGPTTDALASVTYEGHTYSVSAGAGRRNAVAFRVLYRLYQMTVAEPPTTALPPVTISK